MRIRTALRTAGLSALVVLLVTTITVAEPAKAPNTLAEVAAQIEKGRVLFSGTGLGVQVGDMDLQSANVCDYTFSSAPTDWIARSGLWNATNRWTCSPQWSWYGGYSPAGVAALWNKRQFMGDVTVEVYSAFKMRVNRDPTYMHPNDVNVSICGDGANLDSGYSFIIGGDQNRYTRIMRGTKVLAETRAPGALWPIYENGQPSTNEWHHKWWELRCRKIGNRLQIYLDGKLVLEGVDPNPPLPGGRVALWVLQNDMITPRLKIYYEREKLPRDPLPSDPAAIMPTTVVSEAPFTVSSTSHPSFQNDFENDLGRVSTRDADQGAICTLVSGGPEGQGHCLKLVNRAAGGNFGANLIDQNFDAKQLPLLSFDYKLSPDAKVNLYLTCGGKRYEIVFSGSKTPVPGYELLGQIPQVVADDKWHQARFDLLSALQTARGLTALVNCSDLWVGNQSNEGYLLAGFGGNRQGTTWYLDNFMLGQSQGGKLNLAFAPKSGVQIEGYAVAVDSNPLRPAPEKVTVKAASYTADVAEGLQYVHIKPLLKDGKWGANVNYAVSVDRTAPQLIAATPAAGMPLPDAPINLKLADVGGSGLDLTTLKIALNKISLDATSPAVTYDAAQGNLIISSRLAGLVANDSEPVTLVLTGLADRAGNAAPDPVTLTYNVDYKLAKAPLAAPSVQIGEGYLVDDNFEHNMGQWVGYGGGSGAILSRDSSTANSGKYSLKLCNPVAGGQFGVYVTQTPFDAGKYRIVSFAYKADDRLRVNLTVYVNGDWKSIKFSDNDDDQGIIGEVPDVQLDNQWHTTSFNLYDLLRKDDPDAPTFIVRQFVIRDWGWLGNRQGATYHLDDFQIIPVISGLQPVRVAWDAPSLSGMDGAAWVLDSSPSTLVPDSQTSPGNSAQISFNGHGDAWLHLRAVDKAGNWGATTDCRVLVDWDAPVAHPLAPGVDTRQATSQITLNLSDQGIAGIAPSSVKLRVADTDYAVDGRCLTYSPSSGKLIWNGEQLTPHPMVFSDGQRVDVQLISAADYAGNPVTQLPKWSWIMDYALDKEAPVIREIQSMTHPTFLTQTFEDGQTLWTNRDGTRGAKVEIDTANAASGKACLKLTNQVAGGHMQATILSQPFDAEKYPVIAFDYKLPPETKLALSILMRGRWYAITLNDAAVDVIGRVPEIVADNTWRHAAVDIMAMLRRQWGDGPLIVDQLIIGDRNTMDNAAGAVAYFDNFIIGQIGKYPPVLRWRATDATGIKTFSYTLDRDATSVPPETPLGPEVGKSFDALAPGVWYLHLRAQDGAGNWGPPTTYALLHLKAD